jgi:hypothetical protein
MSSNSMVAADNCPSGMPRLLPALAGCWGSSLVLEGRSLIHNRCQTDLRALVEQMIGHLATAWALRRWRGLL